MSDLQLALPSTTEEFYNSSSNLTWYCDDIEETTLSLRQFSILIVANTLLGNQVIQDHLSWEYPSQKCPQRTKQLSQRLLKACYGLNSRCIGLLRHGAGVTTARRKSTKLMSHMFCHVLSHGVSHVSRITWFQWRYTAKVSSLIRVIPTATARK